MPPHRTELAHARVFRPAAAVRQNAMVRAFAINPSSWIDTSCTSARPSESASRSPSRTSARSKASQRCCSPVKCRHLRTDQPDHYS